LLANNCGDAIENAGISANQIAREYGVPQPTITRFVNGADMKASTIDKLAAYFGLKLAKSPIIKSRG